MILVLWKVNAILGNGHRTEGQNYVSFLQGKGMPAGFHYRNFLFGICFWLIMLNKFHWSNG